MTIDIRADVTCNLGPLISGTISDDYIQGNGLIKTKGSCELDGIFTPKSGAKVTFSYTRGGATKQVPRALRVLSSFADPFRKTTKVELGCKLTYMANVSPVPEVDGESSTTTGLQQQQQQGYADYPADTKVIIPIQAKYLAEKCLKEIGVTSSNIPLTNRFFVEEFDFSSGYVTVLSNLLQSEGYLGYLDEDEELQIVDLTQEGGTGPNLDQDHVIDLGPIGIGELPGDAAYVRYNTLRLKKENDNNPTTPEEEAEEEEARKFRDWELEEQTGDPQESVIRYTDPTTGKPVDAYYWRIPYTKSVTWYGKDQRWDPINGSLAQREGLDLSDSPIKRVTTERVMLAQAAANYCSEALSAGHEVYGDLLGNTEKEEYYEYDENGEVALLTQLTWEPFFKWAGGLNVNFVYPIPGNESKTQVVNLHSGLVLVEKVITRYETIYASPPALVVLPPGETFKKEVLGQKSVVQRYQNWAVTQQGQQAISSFNDGASFESAPECEAWLARHKSSLVLVDTQINTTRGRSLGSGQVRPDPAEKVAASNGERVETVANLAFAMGDASSKRSVAFSMPYAPDDYYSPDGSIITSDIAAKALRYGRVQNRLLLGNRCGVSVQVHPRKMPKAPFAPVYLSNKMLSAQYRANAASWAFSKDGIIASLDALYWGVAGGTGTISTLGKAATAPTSTSAGTLATLPTPGTVWVPVAPGVTTFPPLPTVDADGNCTVETVVPPWLETYAFEGVTRTTAVVAVSNYLHTAFAETVELVTKTKYLIGTGLAAAGRTFQVTGYPVGYKFTKGMVASAGAFHLTGQDAGDLGYYVLKADGTTFETTGKAASKQRTFNPLIAAAGSIVVTGHDAANRIGINLSADPGHFALTGFQAAMKHNHVLRATAGAFVSAGQTAKLTQTTPVVLLLHMDGANNSTVFTDSSKYARAMTPAGTPSAYITTAQSKFGGASGYFVNGPYLQTPAAPELSLGDGDFTIECWAYLTQTIGSTFKMLASQASTGSANASWAWWYNKSVPQLGFGYSSSGTALTTLTANVALPSSAWVHLAVVRSGTSLSFYVNGTIVGSPQMIGSVSLFSSTANLIIGSGYANSPSNSWYGYLDEFRLSKLAQYTANFTPPTAAFPDS